MRYYALTHTRVNRHLILHTIKPNLFKQIALVTRLRFNKFRYTNFLLPNLADNSLRFTGLTDNWQQRNKTQKLPQILFHDSGRDEIIYKITVSCQLSDHPTSRPFLSFPRFWRTRGRFCMNRVRSLFSVRILFRT